MPSPRSMKSCELTVGLRRRFGPIACECQESERDAYRRGVARCLQTAAGTRRVRVGTRVRTRVRERARARVRARKRGRRRGAGMGMRVRAGKEWGRGRRSKKTDLVVYRDDDRSPCVWFVAVEHLGSSEEAMDMRGRRSRRSEPSPEEVARPASEDEGGYSR